MVTEGERVTGWTGDGLYTGTVTLVRPPWPGCGDHRHITVRRDDDGTEIETYSDAVWPAPGLNRLRCLTCGV